ASLRLRGVSVCAGTGGVVMRRSRGGHESVTKPFVLSLASGSPCRGEVSNLPYAHAACPACGCGARQTSTGGGAHAGLSPLPAGPPQSVSLAPPGDGSGRAYSAAAQGVCRLVLPGRACGTAGDAGGTPGGGVAGDVHQTGSPEKP